jgi:hypothetical protein
MTEFKRELGPKQTYRSAIGFNKYAHLLCKAGWGPEVEGMTVEMAQKLGVDPPIVVDSRDMPGLQVHFEYFCMQGDQSLSSMKPGGHSWMTGERPKGMTYGRRPDGLFAPDDETSILDASPHYHLYDEYYLITGTKPFHRHDDLGGEVEIWLGCGEQAEQYFIHEPCLIHLVPGLVHGPTIFRNVTSPINFFVFFNHPRLQNQHVRMTHPAYKYDLVGSKVEDSCKEMRKVEENAEHFTYKK